MMWRTICVFVLGVVHWVVALDPTASSTLCVPSRVVSSSIQSDINLGCQYPSDVPVQTVSACDDYLAQEIVTAQQYFCNNQTEAFETCNNVPGVQPGDCATFDPTDASGGEACDQFVLTLYEYCGNDRGYFSPGDPDPVGLAHCLYYQLGLCIADDGTGHYEQVPFQGQLSDCPIPDYLPACGIFPTTSIMTTSTAAPSSSPYTTVAASSTISQASSSPTPFLSTSPNATYFNLVVNGNFSLYVDPDGYLVTNQESAEIYTVQDGQLFAYSGGQIQANQGDTSNTSEPYKVFTSTTDQEMFATAFSLVTQGVDRKRQVVGLTVLLWTNDAFAAPTTSARFCLSDARVYAVLQSGGSGADFNDVCVTITLSAVYVTPPECPCSTSSTVSITAPTATNTVPIINNSTIIAPTACPIGQTLMAFTTVI